MTSQGKNLSLALHCHSTWSYDGRWTLEALAQFFGKMGFDAVLMTEHDTGFAPERFLEYREACSAASTPACSLIPGIEYSSPNNDVHILTWGLESFLAEHRPTIETLDRIREAGGVAVLAHPARRFVWKIFDPAWAPYLSGIEVWNRKTDGIYPCIEAMRLSREFSLPPTVAVDFHRLRHYYPLDNAVTLADGEPAERAIVEAIGTRGLTPRVMRCALYREAGKSLGTAARLHRPLEWLRKSLCSLRG